MEEKTSKISEVIENYAKKRDWLAIEFLLKVLHGRNPSYSPAYQLSKKEFEEKLRSVENTVEGIRKGGESYGLHEVMEEIERIAGAQLRKEIVRWLKQAPSHIINSLFLIAELSKDRKKSIWKIPVDNPWFVFDSYYLPLLYEASFGDSPYNTSKEMAEKLEEYGIGVCYSFPSEKPTCSEYLIPLHHLKLLQNLGKYFTLPRIGVDVAEFLRKELEMDNTEELALLDYACRKREPSKSYVTVDRRLLPEWIKDFLHPIQGIVFWGFIYYGNIYVCFSPFTFNTLKKEIKKMKEELCMPVESKFEKTISKLRSKYEFCEITLLVDDGIGFTGQIDLLSPVPLKYYIVPWLLWVEDSKELFIAPDMEIEKFTPDGKKRPVLIIAATPIKPRIFRKLVDLESHVSLLYFGKKEIYLFSLKPSKELAALVEAFGEEGISIVDKTSEILKALRKKDKKQPRPSPSPPGATTQSVPPPEVVEPPPKPISLPREDFEITFPPYGEKGKKVFGRGELEGKLAFGYEIDDNGKVHYDKLITIDLYDINQPHFGAFQKTRSGKSTLAGNIILQVAFQGIPVVVFDPKPDYVSNIIPVLKTLEHRPDLENGILSRIRETKQDIRGFDFTEPLSFEYGGKHWQIEFSIYSFNDELRALPNCRVLKIPLVSLPPRDTQNYEDICNSIATTLADAVSAVAQKKARELNVLIAKVIKYFSEEHPDKSSMFFDDFYAIMDTALENNVGNKKDVEKLRKLLETFHTAQSFLYAKNESEILDINKIVKNPLDENGDKKTVSISVIDISSLPQSRETPILRNYVSEVCTQLFNIGRSMKVSKPVKVFVVFDEAQNYLPRPTDLYNSVRRILTGGASYGIKAWVIAQSPQNIEKEATKQLTTFICANVSEATIRDDISMYVSDESWTEKLKKTSLGRALIFNKDARPSGKLCLTFSTPQTVDLLAPAEIVELASKRKT